jgi:DNA-binding transcriptional ArsR family regulator
MRQVRLRDGSDSCVVGLWGMNQFRHAEPLRDPAATGGESRGRTRTSALNPGPGSYRLLALLARLGVAGVEPLACALDVSVGSTYSHLRRLAKEGLVWRVPVGDGGGGVVAISRVGAMRIRDEDRPAVYAKSQAPVTAAHARAVSWVAARFALRDGWQWHGPAELRRDIPAWRVQRSDGKGHLPDLGIVGEGVRFAIEVELHSKAHDRLLGILRGYRYLIDRGALVGVGYVTTRPAVARLVRRRGRSGPARRRPRADHARRDDRAGAPAKAGQP